MKLSSLNTEYIFSDYFESKLFDSLSESSSCNNPAKIAENICSKLSIETPSIIFSEHDSEFLAVYSNGVILICDKEITIDTLLHEIAHHVSDSLSSCKNEPEVIDGNMTIFHGHGFVKALEKVYATYNSERN